MPCKCVGHNQVESELVEGSFRFSFGQDFTYVPPHNVKIEMSR